MGQTGKRYLLNIWLCLACKSPSRVLPPGNAGPFVHEQWLPPASPLPGSMVSCYYIFFILKCNVFYKRKDFCFFPSTMSPCDRYGLREFLVITPGANCEAIISESKCSLLLSSVSMCLSNSGWQVFSLIYCLIHIRKCLQLPLKDHQAKGQPNLALVTNAVTHHGVVLLPGEGKPGTPPLLCSCHSQRTLWFTWACRKEKTIFILYSSIWSHTILPTTTTNTLTYLPFTPYPSFISPLPSSFLLLPLTLSFQLLLQE